MFLKAGKWIKLPYLICLLSFVSGCMTMANREEELADVRFVSSTEGVTVNCEGQTTQTPGVIALKKGERHVCRATSGEKTRTVQVPSGVTWGTFGMSTATNFLAWGWWTGGIGLVVGWVVDWSSDAMKDIEDKEIYVEL